MNQTKLLRTGSIVWGHVVQANALLYEDGPHDSPGEVVFPIDPNAPVTPAELALIAQELSKLKGTSPLDPLAKPIAAHLTDQYTRVFGLPVPSAISPQFACELTTILFHRPHLALGILRQPLLPLIVNRSAPRYAMVLPQSFWPVSFRQWWTESHDRASLTSHL